MRGKYNDCTGNCCQGDYCTCAEDDAGRDIALSARFWRWYCGCMMAAAILATVGLIVWVRT